MAQLFFGYGTMNSGKTTEILRVAHNYEEQDKPAVLVTNGLDTRDDVGRVSNRIGLRRDTTPTFERTSVLGLINDLSYKPSCVLIDGYQFLNKHHVIKFTRTVDELDIPVMAFGLKSDLRNELFEDSKYLLSYVDRLERLGAICWSCHKKAAMNLHYIDGKPVYEGDQVQIGGNGAYYPVCRKHYFHPGTMDEKQ